MSAEYSVEKMTQDNVKGASQVEYRCFSDPWSTNLLQKELENPLAYYVVIKEKDKVIGYAGFWDIAKDGQIMSIAVLPEYQGKHLGESLLQEMIKECERRQMQTMSLEVRVSNEKALGLYKKYDFVIEGRRKDYYADNKEDAYIMWKYF